jgi:drug/metabolite transporter (DMT)-like permease
MPRTLQQLQISQQMTLLGDGSSVTSKTPKNWHIPGLGDFPAAGLAHLLVVYIVWGSTYLAIRVAVKGPHGFPPFMLGAGRMLLGGGLLLVWLLATKKRVRLNRAEWLWAAASGLLLWTGGNGMVMFAERYQASGYSALVMGMVPIWVALVELVRVRRASVMLWIGLAVGIVGLGILTLPGLHGSSTNAQGIMALVIASIAWAAGLVLQRVKLAGPDPVTSSAWQQLFGGGGFLIAAAATHEPLPHPDAVALAGFGFLVVVGSLIAFTSFILVTRLLPITLVTTYSYVNPLVAVLLGAVVLGESVTFSTVVGGLFLLAGVAGVISGNRPRATGGMPTAPTLEEAGS